MSLDLIFATLVTQTSISIIVWLRDHPDRLRDHPGLVQGWESVCWGVLGIPLLDFCWISGIYQDSTIVKIFCFGKPWEAPIVLDPRKIKSIQIDSTFAQTYVWFNRIHFCFKIFRFPKNLKIPPSQNSVFVWKALGEDYWFWTTRRWTTKYK